MTTPKNRKTSSLTSEQLLEKRIRDLQIQQRRSIGDFSFGKFKTRKDFLHSIGVTSATPEEDTLPVDINYIREWYAKETERIKTNPAAPAEVKIISQPTEPQSPDEVQIEKLAALFNNPHVKFVPKQNEAAIELLHGIMDLKKRGQLLLAPVGAGKTYICGAVLRTLIDKQWKPMVNSSSPYPMVVVTRATIVEQTMRVLEDQFGLRLGVDVDVTNIDQFRSKFGERFVEEKEIHSWSEVKIVYEWRERMAPALIWLDESQGVKNEDSTQSKIFQAYNDLEGEHYLIGSSATPFMRVSEAKVFAVSTRLEWV